MHFPETNVAEFSVLMVTTSASRTRAIGRALRDKPRADLWLLIDWKELTPETFLHEPVTYDCTGEAGPLVNIPAASSDKEEAAK